MEKEIKIGVLGLKRGLCLAENARQNNMKIVAICDYCPEVLEGALPKFSELGIHAYSDYDEFLTHDMDAVIIANFFNEHAPYAIKALNADKHVISECAANITLAEGVALCRAVESTQKVYMIAENYCYTKFILEMRKIYQSGEIGRVLYAEGEYNHPMSTKEFNAIAPGLNHWRNLIPSTYYCTHATAPLMFITDTVPVQVNALSVPAGDMLEGTARKSPDVFAPILLTMDNDAIFRVTGWGLLQAIRIGIARTGPRERWRSCADQGILGQSVSAFGMSLIRFLRDSKQIAITLPIGHFAKSWQKRQVTAAAIFGRCIILQKPFVPIYNLIWMCIKPAPCPQLEFWAGKAS